MRNKYTPDSHGERITAVETRISALTDDVQNLARTVRDSHDGLSKVISDIAAQVSLIGKGNPTLWIQWLGVGFAVILMASSLTYFVINASVAETKAQLHEQSVVQQLNIDHRKELESMILKDTGMEAEAEHNSLLKHMDQSLAILNEKHDNQTAELRRMISLLWGASELGKISKPPEWGNP